ncbi:MAG TPA: DHA2 family efflux MFS transporter permease subunit [Dehalococcoidia bacterium]|nr:DHA2 family efflux MFS transporter permease subunit [Dehalococcoidia bacterium]
MTAREQQASGFDPRWLTLIVTTIGTFMSILDATIVNIALPDILRDFHSDLDQGQLVLSVYLLALAIVIPVSGYMAERFGMKRMYMITLVLFTAGSALCGIAWNVESLIFFRVLQGLGGGMLQPLGMAIVFSMITPLERGRFMGLLGLPMLLAPIIGPTVGGYLVEYSTWRMIFMINLPVGIINLVLAYMLLKETPLREGVRLDVRGFALAAIAFPALILALSEGEHWGWTSPGIASMFAVGVVAIAAFIRTELRHDDPLLRVALFREPIFALGMGIQFVMQFSLFGLQFLLPLFLQTAHRLSPAETGLVLLPSGIATFITMNFSGRTYNRFGPRVLAVIGLLILIATTGLFSRTTEHTSILTIGALATLRGAAMGFCMMPVQTALFNTVPQQFVTRATALTNVGFRLYGAVSTAVLTTVLTLSLGWHGAPEGSSITRGTAPLNFMSKAFDDAFLLMTGVTAIALLLALFLRDPVLEAVRRGEEEPRPEPVPEGSAASAEI